MGYDRPKPQCTCAKVWCDKDHAPHCAITRRVEVERWENEERRKSQDRVKYGLTHVERFGSNSENEVHYKGNVKHRDFDLPAIFNSWCCEWWINGERHRETGPAVV